MNNEILQSVEKYHSLKRKHASFYDWPDKQIKEAGIVDIFLDPENHKGAHDYVSFSIPSSDPPDAVIYKENEEESLLEITELVNQNAIESQIKGESAYSSECQKWLELDYFQKQLNERIQTKNKKCTALFSEKTNVQLLLFTDEMWLESIYEEHFNTGVSIESHDFSDVWLMLSYSPSTKTYLIIQLCKYVENV